MVLLRLEGRGTQPNESSLPLFRDDAILDDKTSSGSATPSYYQKDMAHQVTTQLAIRMPG